METVENMVEARMILNPRRADGTTSVPISYMPANLVVPITSASIAYPVNNLPTASVKLAIGRLNTEAVRSAVGPFVAKKLVRRVDAIIEARLSGKDETPEDGVTTYWPSDFMTIFEGFTTNISLQKVFDDSGYELHITHWLSQLYDSSVVSSTLHPTVQQDWLYLSPNLEDQKMNSYPSRKITIMEHVLTDVWGSAVLPYFKNIAESGASTQAVLSLLDNEEVAALDEIIMENTIGGSAGVVQITGQEVSDFGNKTALDALDRFVVFDALAGLSDEDKARLDDIVLQRNIAREDYKRQLEEQLAEDTEMDASIPDPSAYDLDVKYPKLTVEEALILYGEELLSSDGKTLIDKVKDANANQDLPALPVAFDKNVSCITLLKNVTTVIDRLMTADVRYGATFWERLLYLSSSLGLHVIPSVNSAAVVAIGLGTRTPHRTIEAGEVLLAQTMGTTDRLPRGLVFLTRMGGSPLPMFRDGTVPIPGYMKFDLLAGLLNEYNEDTAMDAPIPEIKTDEEIEAIKANVLSVMKGQWIFMQAPWFLENQTAIEEAFDKTVKPNGTGTLSMSGAGGLGKVTGNIADKIYGEDQARAIMSLGKLGAQYRLLSSIFGRRGLTIATKFRLDIAPGSTVRVNTMGGGITNLPLIGDYSGVLQGVVMQVSLNLNSETQEASTVLSIANVRNEAEIACKSLTPPGHPMYLYTWSGGYLGMRDPKTKQYASMITKQSGPLATMEL